MQRFRGGLVFKAHRLCVSLNSRLESNKEEEEDVEDGGDQGRGSRGCPPGKREFKVPWREADPPNHHDDKVDSDQ